MKPSPPLSNDCIENVIEQYSDTVYRLAFARTGTKHDADDIFQEVFMKYVKKKPKFETEAHQKAWLIRVTINCCNSFWRSFWRKKTDRISDELIWEDRENIDLNDAIQALPEKYREVIHLFYYEDMSLEEISETLRRKNSTVRTQLTRARAQLKILIKEEDYV